MLQGPLDLRFRVTGMGQQLGCMDQSQPLPQPGCLLNGQDPWGLGCQGAHPASASRLPGHFKQAQDRRQQPTSLSPCAWDQPAFARLKGPQRTPDKEAVEADSPSVLSERSLLGVLLLC